MKTSSPTSSLEDPVVEEIRQIRAQLAREANFDLHAICERARERERQLHEVVLVRPATSKP